MRLSKDMTVGLMILGGLVLLGKRKTAAIRLPTTVIDVSPGSPTADDLEKRNQKVLPLVLLPLAK